MRRKCLLQVSKNPSVKGETVGGLKSTAFSVSPIIDPSLTWSDITWFKEITKMPIVLKGVQSVALSNHGGRRLDFARPSMDILEEVMPILRGLGWENRVEIFLDVRVRRGTDIIKTLCLGARGVGLGRPFAYAIGAYSLPGIDRAMQLLKDEIEADMRLLGCTSVDQLVSKRVDI